VAHLKAAIQHLVGIPSKQQTLVFDTRQLHNGSTLAECNIQLDSTIFLILRRPQPRVFCQD
jgi:hypothetical protein